MASASDEVISISHEEKLTLEDFRLWSTNALKAFLRVRKKTNSGSFDELVARAYTAYEDCVDVCPAIEHEERKFLIEYLEKLNIYENSSVAQEMLPDPLEIGNEFWMSESLGIFKWPSLYYHDIAKYLDHLAPTFISQLESEYKLGKAYRYFSCEFVREIHYFDLEGTDFCILKSKVVPSQRVNNKPYDVWVILQKDTADKPGGDILSAYCTCTAGLHGSCNHVVGMLFRMGCMAVVTMLSECYFV